MTSLVASSVAWGASASGAVTTPATVAGSTQSSVSVWAAPTAVEATGRSKFSEIYGGLAGVDDGASIQVFLTRLDPAAMAELQQAAGSIPVSFKLTDQSAVRAESVMMRIRGLVAQWQARGIEVNRFYPDVRSGHVKIGIKNLTEGERADVASSFTRDDFVDTMSTETEIIPATAYRNNDLSPWNGGDNIMHVYPNGNVGTCSTAFGINRGGTTQLLTAAHCGGTGWAWYNAACDLFVGCPLGGNALIGTIAAKDTRSAGYGYDAAVLDGRGSKLVFSGTPSSSNKLAITGPATTFTGYTVCNSGSYAGYVCGITVDYTNGCDDYDDYNLGTRWVCGLAKGSTTGAIASESGDSGGPVIKTAGGVTYAMGIVYGAEDASKLPSCQYYLSHDCYSTLVFTQIAGVLSYFNATLVTN